MNWPGNPHERSMYIEVPCWVRQLFTRGSHGFLRPDRFGS
jgi:hypothetical protein